MLNEVKSLEERKESLVQLGKQKGYITYRFPLNKIKPSSVKEVSIELELCSETAYYKEEWPSDITFSIAGIELFTYCSPGDFGKTRGLLNPSWWPDSNTQYGLLKKFYITNNGVYIDDKRVNESFNINTLKKLSKESLQEDKILKQLNEKKAVRLTYGLVSFYSLLLTFFPRLMMEYKTELKDLGISIQLIVYILFFNLLHFVVKKYRSFLVRRIGVLTINALITYTYCCVIMAIIVSNGIDWGRLFKAF